MAKEIVNNHPIKTNNMKKTALQKAIEQIEIQAKDYEKRGNSQSSESLLCKSEALNDSLNLLQSLLPIEQQQIKESFDCGFNRGLHEKSKS